jgi:hypothetical protein
VNAFCIIRRKSHIEIADIKFMTESRDVACITLHVNKTYDRRYKKLSRYRPEQAHGDPVGKAPDFLDVRHMKVVGRQPYAPAGFTPRSILYSFLEAESTPGHMVLSLASEKIPSDSTGDRSRDLPTSSAQPLLFIAKYK